MSNTENKKIGKRLQALILNENKAEESLVIRNVNVKGKIYWALVDIHPAHPRPKIISCSENLHDIINSSVDINKYMSA